jgi:hypothetical protein
MPNLTTKKEKNSINVGISSEAVILNIGGVQFETFRSTLLKQPESSLADPSFLSRYHRPQQGDYFFDRDPDMFKVSSWANILLQYIYTVCSYRKNK